MIQLQEAQIYDSAERPAPLVEEFTSLLRYRELVAQLISRSVKIRYKRSALGVAWTMLNPLLTMVVLTVVFSSLFRYPTRNYALYVLSGLLVWSFFAQTTTAAIGDLMWSGGLLGRIFVPKSVFAVAAVGTGLVNLGLALIPYTAIALLLGERVPATALLLPVPILSVSLFALGVGLAVSAASIYFPDVMPTYEVLLTAWMYLTPIIYPVEALPESVQGLLRLNPLYHPVQSIRALLLDGQVPEVELLGLGLLSGLAAFGAGWWLFTRRAREYAYRV